MVHPPLGDEGIDDERSFRQSQRVDILKLAEVQHRAGLLVTGLRGPRPRYARGDVPLGEGLSAGESAVLVFRHCWEFAVDVVDSGAGGFASCRFGGNEVKGNWSRKVRNGYLELRM